MGETSATRSGRRIAVIGSGVSGLTAAYLLTHAHDVILYEQDNRLGGHVHTHSITDSSGMVVPVDSGFIVHNDRTYPLLARLFSELGIERHATEMSMSIKDPASGLEYAGGRGAKGVFAQPRRTLDRSFLRLIMQVRRFNVRASALLADEDDTRPATYGEFLHSEGFDERFIRLYAIPVVSCVWSTGTSGSLDYPARYLFRFLANHGMLSVSGSPTWYTVVGGARTYVDRIASGLRDIRSGTAVRSVTRHDDGVDLEDISGGRERVDAVVMATHPDQALAVLTDSTDAERRVLGAFRYSSNETILHTDSSLLPSARQARAAWNYLTPDAGTGDDAPVVTYWMNRLQGLHTQQQYLVSLNARHLIDPATVIAVMRYSHPIYDGAAVRAQAQLESLASPNTVFAGAYHGWGFHEDGCRSGAAASEHFGVTW